MSKRYRTRQEIFDTAYLGLASQGFERSMDGGDFCAYRGESGRRCAIGWCIEDSSYTPLLEGHEVYCSKVLRRARIRRADDEFANLLQIAHDVSDTPHVMQRNLAAFAAEHGLTIPAVPAKEDTA